jgi:hypothetical protein
MRRRLAGFGPLFEMIENPSDDDRASIQAITLTAPPHCSHVSISILKTRLHPKQPLKHFYLESPK